MGKKFWSIFLHLVALCSCLTLTARATAETTFTAPTRYFCTDSGEMRVESASLARICIVQVRIPETNRFHNYLYVKHFETSVGEVTYTLIPDPNSSHSGFERNQEGSRGIPTDYLIVSQLPNFASFGRLRVYTEAVGPTASGVVTGLAGVTPEGFRFYAEAILEFQSLSTE